MTRFILFFILLIFQNSVLACQLGDIKLDTDFSNATSENLLSKCTTNDDNTTIFLELKPENTPINNSPWYAFKLSSKIRKTVKVKISIKDGNHRYPPKISNDGKHWEAVKFDKSEHYLTIKLQLNEKPIWLAGQELITNEDYINWGKSLSKKIASDHQIIGYSVDNNPIYQITMSDKAVNKWLVILGRQHPPEVTGALALFPFATTILSKSELASVFKKHYNVLIIPNVNPDGVELGYWRHNKNGVDLNRDWNKFKQPEVAAIDKLLTNIVKAGGEVSMAVDFHSTHKDIFYTMPNDYDVKQRYLVNNWLNRLDKLRPNFNVIQKPGNNPGRGVFKQYIADKFKVHAITYEMGDNTDRQLIRKLAIDAANTLMQTMLLDNNQKHEQ